jgi:CBS domain containing-hemolysin-like protein
LAVWWVLVVLVVLAMIMTAGFYGGMENGAYKLNRVRLRLRVEEGWRSAKILSRLLADPEGTIALSLIGTNLSVWIATTVTIRALEGVLGGATEYVATLGLAFVMFPLAEVGPKNVFQRQADVLMYRLARPLEISRKLFSPLIASLKAVTRTITWLLGARRRPEEPLVSRKRVEFYLVEGASEGVLSTDEGRIAANVLRVREVVAREAMAPLAEIDSVEIGTPRDELYRRWPGIRYTRLPVWSERPDNVVGVVNLLELFVFGSGDRQVADVMQPAEQMPADLPILEALTRLRSAVSPMAVVTDSDGSALGIVTPKDLVEEIVGELEAW